MKRLAVADYYREAARWMLPHLKDVPVSWKRYPGPLDGLSFWEKDAPSFTPSWIRTVDVPRRSDGTSIHYIVVDEAKTLTWMAGVGGLEIHPFLHRAPRLDEATAAVFDLDPGEGATFADCCEVALILRRVLMLESFAKVSGSKGLQLYVPLNGDASHDAAQLFAKTVAEALARACPDLVVAEMAKALRRKKVLIDWSQNADYKTTVGVYSLRATGLVSMPVTWKEVEARKPLAFTPAAALARLRKRGDLFAPLLTMTQNLPISLRERRSRLSRRGPGRTQSGRRRFVKTTNELRLQDCGTFPVRSAVEDSGTYEILEYDDRCYDLWLNGGALRGPWRLEKLRRSWTLAPTA